MAATEIVIQPELTKTELKELNLIEEYRDIQEMENHEVGVARRIGQDVATWGREQVEPGHRIERAGALAIGGITQVLDRGRAMVFVLPTVFDEITNQAIENSWNGYQSATAAGLAVGGIFATWGWIVGKSCKYAIDKYPKTTEKFIENHPVTISVLNRAIGGFPTKRELQKDQPEMPKDGYDIKPYQTRKSLIGKAGLAVSRGLRGGLMYGTTAHVGVAKANKHSDESNDQRRRVVTAESGVALGGIAVAVSALMTHNTLGLAEDIKEIVTDKELWRNIAIGSIVYTAISNKFSRLNVKRKARKLLAGLEQQNLDSAALAEA